MSIFRTKPIERIIQEAAAEGSGTLRRVLGPVNLVTLGVGAIIGTGIFVLTGQAAAAYAGPAIVLSMVLAGLASALAGLCYAEFASTVPIAGSAYTYGYATLGEFIAWIIGWDLILEYALGAATVAVGWSGYVVSFLADLGIHVPPALSAAPGTVLTVAGGGTVTAVFNLPAVLITALVTALLVVGIKESATVNAVIVVVKVTVVVVVIAAGAVFVNMANLMPFVPPNQGRFGAYGWSGVLRGAGVIFFAYIGFDAVSTAAQEAKNPQRDMPIGILGSLLLCTILYVAVSGVMVGLVPYQQLGVAAPMAVAIDAARVHAQGTAWAALMGSMPYVVKIGAIAGLSSVMVVMMMGQPRIFYSMASDGLLPPWAKKIHPRFRTPHITTLVTGIIVGVAAGFTPISVLGELVSIGTLLAFVIVSVGVLALRRRRPELHRPFRTPLVPLVPILSAAVALSLMLGLPWQTWKRLLIWMLVGIALYFAYGRRHSLVQAEAAASQEAR
ncbi:MAG: amino acid permease [Myxococcales bacterium]|nr:amino acid permease [Myxococcota bacterium]MDW8281345.1 amino acid permease [Myxococcales bacterium]